MDRRRARVARQTERNWLSCCASQNVSRRFGGLLALDRASFSADEGQIVALIGPNGAGKTTLFAIITGFLRADDGRVRYHGDDITGEPPHLLARRGIARTFQIVQPFAGLTVRENIAVGTHLLAPQPRRTRSRPPRRSRRRSALRRCSILPAANLTVAGRKRLELARALAIEPKLLLLDEVLAGLNPSEIRDMVPVIQAIRDRGITIVMIEHVMQAVMSLAEQVFVLAEGRMIAMGPPQAIAADQRVIEAYLGHGAAARMQGAARGVSLLAVTGLHAGYGATEILRGIDLAVHERRDRRGARLERRRQVDAQPRDLRRAAAVARRDLASRARRSSARALPRSWRAA